MNISIILSSLVDGRLNQTQLRCVSGQLLYKAELDIADLLFKCSDKAHRMLLEGTVQPNGLVTFEMARYAWVRPALTRSVRKRGFATMTEDAPEQLQLDLCRAATRGSAFYTLGLRMARERAVSGL